MFRDHYFIVGFAISILILFIAGLLLWVFFSNWDAQSVILNRDIYEGVNILGDTGKVFGIFGLGVFIILLNFSLALYFYRHERFLSYLFSFASVAFSILILIAAGALVYFN